MRGWWTSESSYHDAPSNEVKRHDDGLPPIVVLPAKDRTGNVSYAMDENGWVIHGGTLPLHEVLPPPSVSPKSYEPCEFMRYLSELAGSAYTFRTSVQDLELAVGIP